MFKKILAALVVVGAVMLVPTAAQADRVSYDPASCIYSTQPSLVMGTGTMWVNSSWMFYKQFTPVGGECVGVATHNVVYSNGASYEYLCIEQNGWPDNDCLNQYQSPSHNSTWYIGGTVYSGGGTAFLCSPIRITAGTFSL